MFYRRFLKYRSISGCILGLINCVRKAQDPALGSGIFEVSFTDTSLSIPISFGILGSHLAACANRKTRHRIYKTTPLFHSQCHSGGFRIAADADNLWVCYLFAGLN